MIFNQALESFGQFRFGVSIGRLEVAPASNIYTYKVLIHRLRDYHQQQQQQRCIMPFSQKNSKHLRQQEQE